MATKAKFVKTANKNIVQFFVQPTPDGYVIELDAWNRIFAGWASHGFTASGDTLSEAYDDAINLIETLVPCEIPNCTDKFHRY